MTKMGLLVRRTANERFLRSGGLIKKDSDIKILIGSGENEKQLVLDAHNNSEYIKGILEDAD